MGERSSADRSYLSSHLGLVIGFGAIMALMVLIAFITLSRMESTQRHLERVVDNHMAKFDLVVDMRRAARERTVNLQNMILLSDPFERDAHFLSFHQHAADFVRARTTYLQMGLTAQERVTLQRQGELTRVAVPLQERVLDLAMQERIEEAHELLVQQAVPAQDSVLAQLEDLYTMQENAIDVATEGARLHYAHARLWIALLVGLLLLLGLAIALAVIRRTSRAEASLFQEKEQALVTLYSIGEGVITTDATGRVRHLNPLAEKLTGWPVTEARGRCLTEVLKIFREGAQVPIKNLAQQTLCLGEVVSATDDIVLLTRNGEEYAVELTAAPIHDRANQGIGAVVAFRDVTEMRALSRELGYQATHDPLTGLMNRREFERQLQLALDDTSAEGDEHALCYVDLNLFKLVNDTCGHAAGDELLRQLGARIRNKLRRDDLLARLGGDEFGVLLRVCTLEEAEVMARILCKAIQDFRFVWEDKVFEVGASIGVVAITHDSGSLSDVLRAADFACYSAKEDGRNCMYVFRPDDIRIARKQGEAYWMQRINQALQNDQLTLYCQPIKPLNAGRGLCEHGELMIRLHDAEEEIVGPLAFLPAVERYHLMPIIDRWVIAEAFEAIAQALARSPDDCCIFNINLSGQSLSDPQFLDYVRDKFEQFGLPGAHFCFEITETAAISNLDSAQRMMAALKTTGCSFALDDFGTGLSSFSYLKHLPVDFLKIDGDFVRNVEHDHADLAMVRSINQVAHYLGIKTVAEYVESEGVREVLAHVGVDYGQGYALAAPLPLQEFLRRRCTGLGVKADAPSRCAGAEHP